MKVYVETKKYQCDYFDEELYKKMVYIIESESITDYIKKSQEETPGFFVMKDFEGKEVAIACDEVFIMMEERL